MYPAAGGGDESLWKSRNNARPGNMNVLNIHLVTAFITRQIDQIRKGGWLELKRKLKLAAPMIIRLPVLLLELPFALLIVLAVRLIRPFCLVRFQRFISWRIGHFAANTELYLCERDAGINVPKGPFVDIWYNVTNDYNKQLSRMWGRVVNIGPQHLLRVVVRLNSLIPGADAHRIGHNTQRDRDVHNLLDRFPPHLSFLPEEERRGQAGMRALGIPAGAPFICLIVRDSAYLNDQSSRANVKVNWSYHNFRNCDVQRYVRAAQALASRGYYVIRMGAVVKEAMKISHSMVIDYAVNGMRSDFLDIYLGAKCEFCISNGTGFDAVPSVFRRPIVFVDVVPLGVFQTFCSKFIAVTKKHWLRHERRFMTFREIFESGTGYFEDSGKFEDMGIDLIESTPEEIAAVVLEMEGRVKGTWQTTKEDVELQRRFWEIYPRSEQHGEIRSRVGAEFLRRNKTWLE
jgi:putative glycosyltransferase (TIGR04372 family)